MKAKISHLFGFLLTFLLVASIATAQDESKTIKVGVVNGRVVSLPTPEYPAAARAVRAGGAVNVQISVDEAGEVTSAKAISGHPLFRQAAEKAALEAKFKPFVLSGRAIKVSGILIFNFVANTSLNKDEKSSDKEELKNEQETPDVDEKKIIKAGVINGKAVSLPSPVYPAAAQAVRAAGAVNIEVTVDEKGEVVAVKIVSGHPLLRAAAEEAAWQAKFKPTLLKGEPTAISGIIVYNFVAPAKK